MQSLVGSSRSIEALLRTATLGPRSIQEPPSGGRCWAQGPTIALSRDAGAGAAAVARALSVRLGWPVYDNELLEHVAREMNVRAEMLEAVDERHRDWLQECIEAFGGGASVSEASYVRHLVETIFALAARGRCILVGRGAVHVLPPSTTLRVRLVAPREARLRAVAAERGCSEQEAARYVETCDRERERFIRDHFHVDPHDAPHYDLVLNTSRIAPERCAELIVQALAILPRPVASATAPQGAVPA
jgi:cytidylate kinase